MGTPMNLSIRTAVGLLCTLFAALWCASAPAQAFGQIDLARPGDRDFVLDSADMISDTDEQQIKELADKLLTDKAAPIIVVTIESMAQHGGQGMSIETFAARLFDQWGIGPAKLGETPWNRGILLLIAQQDRKARIELGAGWKHDKDAVAQQIMDNLLIPRFKRGDFSGGIVAAVQGLDHMARGLELPPPPRPTWHYVLGAILLGLIVFTLVSHVRSGSRGWAWLMWGGLFGLIGTILYNHTRGDRNGSLYHGGYYDGGYSGGSFGGGSFGGGSSGGGGASGSW
jgi:uncharacterized protein